jgi:5-methylcytosine-specific restriction enzyme subunit McrC
MAIDTAASCGGWSLATDREAQASAASLKSKVEIRPGLKGLEIEATSFVGSVTLGPLTISIRPKMGLIPLSRLLRYAYGLRDIQTFEEAPTATSQYSFQELLIQLLAAEVEELVQRGLARLYVPFADTLEQPRGRLNIAEVARRGGVREARLPCLFYERHIDWVMNQVVLAGLQQAAMLAVDRDLRHRVLRLAMSFGGIDAPVPLRTVDLDSAERCLTRLTAAYRSSLVLIRLLHEMSGSDVAGAQPLRRVSGHLFDMNKFYQRLLSRFLRENLTDRQVRDEYTLHDIFAYAAGTKVRRQSVPRPRPDFAVFEGTMLRGFLDAKYRDLWDKELPTEWLYQLSIYALASPNQRSVMLYATTSKEAQEEQIDVRSPHLSGSSVLGSVILRPVDLGRLSDLTHPFRANQFVEARRRYADELAATD